MSAEQLKSWLRPGGKVAGTGGALVLLWQLQSGVDTLNAKVGQMSDRLTENTVAVSTAQTLNVASNKRIDDLQARLDRIDKRIERIQNHLDKH